MYNPYESLGVDPSMPSQGIVVRIDELLASTDESQGRRRGELEVLRKVFSDSNRRALVDEVLAKGEGINEQYVVEISRSFSSSDIDVATFGIGGTSSLGGTPTPMSTPPTAPIPGTPITPPVGAPAAAVTRVAAKPAGGMNSKVVFAILAAIVLVGGLVFALTRGSDSNNRAATPSTSTSTRTITSTSTSRSTAYTPWTVTSTTTRTTTARPTSTRSTATRPRTALGRESEYCSGNGYYSVYKMTTITSCEFSVSVANEVLDYLDRYTVEVDQVFRITAYSPVTNKNYDMRCTNVGYKDISCTGGNDAHVLLRADY